MRLIDSNRVTFGTKISDRIWLDNNGQLICRDAIIARTGSYDYLESEIKQGGDKHKIVKVYRTDDEVFDPVSMASFENKPFVDDHPQEDVSPENFKELSKGYIRDIRRGTGEFSNCLVCDIVVTDPETAEEIKSGRKRELSLGYDTNIVMKDGKYTMTNIRGNHLALVDRCRAGCATIRDSAKAISRTGGLAMKKSRVTLFDDDIYEVEEIREDDDMDVVEEKQNAVEELQDDEPTLAQIYQLLLEIKSKLDNQVTDDDEVVEGEKVVEKPAEEVVEDDDDVVAEEAKAEEVVEDDDEEVEEEVKEDELLDADEELAEEEIEASAKDSKSVYKKFVKAKDSSTKSLSADVTAAWQERYNRLAKKSY